MKTGEIARISPEKAMKILQKEGVAVSPEEAKAILEFLRIIAKIAVSQYLRDGNS